MSTDASHVLHLLVASAGGSLFSAAGLAIHFEVVLLLFWQFFEIRRQGGFNNPGGV